MICGEKKQWDLTMFVNIVVAIPTITTQIISKAPSTALWPVHFISNNEPVIQSIAPLSGMFALTGIMTFCCSYSSPSSVTVLYSLVVCTLICTYENQTFFYTWRSQPLSLADRIQISTYCNICRPWEQERRREGERERKREREREREIDVWQYPLCHWWKKPNAGNQARISKTKLKAHVSKTL